MSDPISEKVLTEMFSKFPVKLLMRCRCVCKAWNSLITNFKKIDARNSELLLFRYCIADERLVDEGRYFLCPDECFPLNPVEELDCPLKGIVEFINIVGSCNGVYCLSDDVTGFYFDRAALWNPSIRKIVTIPAPNVTYRSHTAFIHSLGFGFDSTTDDYKLVRVVYLESEEYNFDVIPPLVEVYSLRSRSWRMVRNDLRYLIGERKNAAFVNGACHWVASRQDEDGLRKLIVSFDLRDELFREMEIPNCLVKERIFMDVAVFDGSLLLVPFQYLNNAKECLSVWMMKEYGVASSWTKLIDFGQWERIRRLVGFKQNGNFVLVKGKGQLILYDPNTQETMHTGIVSDVESFYLDTYVESLVLLGESNEFSEKAFCPTSSQAVSMELDYSPRSSIDSNTQETTMGDE